MRQIVSGVTIYLIFYLFATIKWFLTRFWIVFFFFIFSFCLAHLFLYLESSIGKEEQNILTLYYFHLIATFDCYPLLTLASNAGSELFMSTNDNPKTKTMITYVDGGFPTGQYEYDRHDQLRSLTYQNYYSTENNFFFFWWKILAFWLADYYGLAFFSKVSFALRGESDYCSRDWQANLTVDCLTDLMEE